MVLNFQDIMKDPEWDIQEGIWEPPPEQKIPGVTFSGLGLHTCVAGALSTFLVTFENCPVLPNFRVIVVEVDDDGREIVDTSMELNFEVIPGYGFRVLYVLHDDVKYRIKIMINDSVVSKPLRFFGSTVYHDHMYETWQYMFNRIQRLTEYFEKVMPPVLKIINETQQTVELINNAADSYRTALEATQTASESSAGVGIKLLEIMNAFRLPAPAAADQPGGDEPDIPGGGPDGRPPRNGPEDGRPQRPQHPPPPRPQHPPPPPPPPKPKKKSTPSMFMNSVFFNEDSVGSLPDLGAVDRESPPGKCSSEPTFVGFMVNFPSTTTTTDDKVSDERDTPKSHQPDTPRSPGKLKRKRDHFDFNIQHITNDLVDVVDQMSQAVDDVVEALHDDPDILDEGGAEPMEEVEAEPMEEVDAEPMEEAFNLFNDSYAISPTAAACPINYSNADDIGRPSKRHCSHSITDILSPPPLDLNLDSSSDETSWSELMANLEVARIFMPPSSCSSSSSYVSVRRSFTPPRASTPKPNQRRAGRMTLRPKKRVDYKEFF